MVSPMGVVCLLVGDLGCNRKAKRPPALTREVAYVVTKPKLERNADWSTRHPSPEILLFYMRPMRKFRWSPKWISFLYSNLANRYQNGLIFSWIFRHVTVISLNYFGDFVHWFGLQNWLNPHGILRNQRWNSAIHWNGLENSGFSPKFVRKWLVFSVFLELYGIFLVKNTGIASLHTTPMCNMKYQRIS